MMYSAGMPAMSADSGWPWPDIRWHAPHANRLPGPPATDAGAGGCSSGNQSGGFVLPATLAHSYSRALPGARTMPSGRTAEGCSLSGMLNAHSGSRAGRVSCSCALTSCAVRSEATAHIRTAMDVLARRITVGLLSWTKVGFPDEGRLSVVATRITASVNAARHERTIESQRCGVRHKKNGRGFPPAIPNDDLRRAALTPSWCASLRP